jgi:hypothetical protein
MIGRTSLLCSKEGHFVFRGRKDNSGSKLRAQ